MLLFVSCNHESGKIKESRPKNDIRFYFFKYLFESPNGEYIIFKNRNSINQVKEYITENKVLLFAEKYKNHKSFDYIEFSDGLLDSLATGKKIFELDSSFININDRCREIKIDFAAQKILTMNEQDFFKKYVKENASGYVLNPPDDIDYGVFIKYLFERNYLVRGAEEPFVIKFDNKTRDEFLKRKSAWKTTE